MKHILFSLLTFLVTNLTAQSLKLDWGYANGSTGEDAAYKIAVDAAGNTYATGSFTGTVDFDKGPDTANLSVAAGQTEPDAFVLKLDPQGNYVWAIRIGGLDNTEQVGLNIIIDNAGDILVTGLFYGNVLLPPNTTNYNTSFTVPGTFMVKINATGSVLWSRAWAHNTNQIIINDIVVDNTNNIIAIGSFNGVVDFSTSSVPNLKTSAGGTDLFVMKLNASGSLTDIITAGNSFDGNARHIANSGNSFWISGYFMGTLDFDFGSATNNLISTNTNFRDVYMLRLDSNLAFEVALNLGAGIQDFFTYDLLDANGQYAYHVGYFKGTNIDFDPSPAQTLLFSTNYSRGFIQKFDNQGNLVWARAFTQGASTGVSAISWQIQYPTLTPSGGIMVHASYSGAIDVHPNPNFIINQVCPPGGGCSGLIELAATGVFLNFQYLGTQFNAFDINRQASKIYLGGQNYASPPAQILTPNNTFSSNGLTDILLAKIQICKDTTVADTATVCGSYMLSNGQIITQNGTYIDSLQSANGCDSLVSLTLTIDPAPGTSVVQFGDTLAAQSGLTYQWFNCQTNQIIVGANAQIFVPTANGQYAVIVTFGNCTDTSACVAVTNIGLQEAHILEVHLYPNPTSGLLQIDCPQMWLYVEVTDLTGRALISQKGSSETLDLSALPAGVYVVKLLFENGVVRQKVVKE